MKKEDVTALAQLLTAMKDEVARIKDAQKKKDAEQLALAKQELAIFQKKIQDIL